MLEVTGLEKSYVSPEGEVKTVVSVARFAMSGGEQVALQGGSGSGKTTFLNLIAGIVKADAGKIVLEGQELSAMSEVRRDAVRAAQIGYVYQSFNLLQGYTCLENVLLAMAFGGGRNPPLARELLDRVGLSHRLSYYPRQLSIGQQQRVAVARSLANRPRLVLADEPTGNLDESLAEETLALMQATCSEQNAALLLVSHDRKVLSRFGRVIEFGRLNSMGPPK